MENRKLPVKTATVTLDGDYEGWKFTARVNPPLSSLGKLQSGMFDGICEGIASTVVDWNFVDEDGEPLPAPREEMNRAKEENRAEVKAGHRELDRDFEQTMMIKAGARAAGRLPYDLVEQLTEKLVKAITSPEKNS